MTIWHKISRFFHLNNLERRVFIIALVLAPVVSMKLKLSGIKGTLAWLDHLSRERSNGHLKNKITLVLAQRISFFVKKANIYSLHKGTCLSQSMMLWYLLRRQGIDCEICIGVQKKEKGTALTSKNLDAHAWVEYRGSVLNDQPDVRQRFSAFEYIIGTSEK
jgi:hypothetical protein